MIVKKLAVIVAVSVIAIAVGVAVGVFVVGPRLSPKAPTTADEIEKDKTVLYDLPKMTVNLSDPSWIIQISLTLRFRDQKALDEVIGKDPDMYVIRDIVISVLSTKTPEDFTSEKIKDVLNEIKDKINAYYGEDIVVEVLCTDKLLTKLPM